MAVDIARAWKASEYRKTLTPEELASLPPNPAGVLSEDDLSQAVGGNLMDKTVGGTKRLSE